MALNANARKWVNALRSGKYQQTNSYLRDSEGYCCLGVACDLYHKETGKGKWVEDGGVFNFQLANGRKLSQHLPRSVADWLGIRDEWGSYGEDEGGLFHSLASRNDDGFSFKEIADIVVKKPKGLFKRGQ
jgi:hypothetical protein